MTKDQFMEILRKLQQLQQMAVGEAIDFKLITYRRQDEAAAVDFMLNLKDKYIRSGTMTENEGYEMTSKRVKDLMEYMRSNKWI